MLSRSFVWIVLLEPLGYSVPLVILQGVDLLFWLQELVACENVSYLMKGGCDQKRYKEI